MIKKGTLLVMLLIFIMAIAGCGTVKAGVRKSWQIANTGAKKSWQAVQAADNWVQKHLW